MRQDKYRKYLGDKETYIQMKIKEESQIITENNIFVNLESHVRVNGTDQYEEDFFIFSEVNKENQ